MDKLGNWIYRVIRWLVWAFYPKLKVEGGENNLIELIKQDEMFKAVWEHIDEVLEAKNFIGRAPSQTVEFITAEIDPILEKHADMLGDQGDVRI